MKTVLGAAEIWKTGSQKGREKISNLLGKDILYALYASQIKLSKPQLLYFLLFQQFHRCCKVNHILSLILIIHTCNRGSDNWPLIVEENRRLAGNLLHSAIWQMLIAAQSIGYMGKIDRVYPVKTRLLAYENQVTYVVQFNCLRSMQVMALKGQIHLIQSHISTNIQPLISVKYLLLIE